MERLGLLLLNIISGYMKKRQQAEKRKEIESAPDWEDGIDYDKQANPGNIENFLNDLFETNPKVPNPSPLAKNIIKNEREEILKDDLIVSHELIDEDIQSNDEDLTDIDEQLEKFENNIYHSKLSEKKEMHLGNKWSRKRNVRKDFFESKKSLKKAIILKEILDKPLSIRR